METDRSFDDVKRWLGFDSINRQIAVQEVAIWTDGSGGLLQRLSVQILKLSKKVSNTREERRLDSVNMMCYFCHWLGRDVAKG